MIKTSDIIWQDLQHQRLFEMIEEVKVNINAETLEKLRDYIDSHFSIEEKYMRELNYPHAEEHIRAHRLFSEKVHELFDNNILLDDSVGKELSEFLYTWLKSHILVIDKELEAFLIENHNAI